VQPAAGQSCSVDKVDEVGEVGGAWRTWRLLQRSAQSSPRRAPVVMASQTNSPKPRRQLSDTSRAVCSGVGGHGSRAGGAGLRARSIGLTATRSQRMVFS
jgi:hypothetical protein